MEDKINTDECRVPPLKKIKLDQSTNGISKEEAEKLKLEGIDREYFESYSDIEVHRTMIEDQVRTDTYRKAIMHDPSLIKDKVVCDVGCGSAILSMFCAQAGAKKVYAIDASKIAVLAKKNVEASGFASIITVFESKAEDVELPEKVDVIISEWMGYMLLYETMLPSVIHIRDKWLKPGGVMLPDKAVIYGALSEAPWITPYEESTFDFWVSMGPMYNLNFAAMADLAVTKYKNYAHVNIISQSDVASLPQKILSLDLMTCTDAELQEVQGHFSVQAMGSRMINSFVFWFDVTFPGDIVLTTSPHCEETHWQQVVLPIEDTQVTQDMRFDVKLTIAQHRKRSLGVTMDYKAEGKEGKTRDYMLDENCADIM